MTTISRRTFTGSLVALPVAAAVAGCVSTTSAGSVTNLRFGFWGNDLRVKTFAQVVDLFEQANPDAKVTSEHADFGPYFERLAVQTAGNEAPDVISMDFAYLSEYAARGALLDLSAHGVASENFPRALLDTGTVDGQLLGLAHGMSALALLANPKTVKAAGGQLPDDTAWTWDELIELCAELSRSTKGKITGMGGGTFLSSLALQSFLAERSRTIFTADGAIGITADDLTAWWALMMKAVATGAIPAPAKVVEESQKSLDQSGLATGTVGLDTFWSNQVAAVSSTADAGMELLHFPTAEGSRAAPVVYQPTVYWTASARSKNPDAAVRFINFFATDPAAAAIIGTDRGLPADEKARASLLPTLTKTDRAAADYIGADASSGVAPFPPPVGGSAFGDAYARATTNVLFGREQPDAAAAAVIAELTQAIKK